MGIESETIIFYTASFAFFFTVFLELWRRTRVVKKHHKENPLSDRMEKAIHYFRSNTSGNHITNDIYQKLTKVSDSTATRDLEKLEELGFLDRRGKTSNTFYIFTPKTQAHAKSHRINVGS